MKLHIIAVGQKMPNWISAGFDEYAKRMPKETAINLIELKSEKRATGKTSDQIKIAEHDRIIAAIPHDSTLWVLDERGEQLTTLALATHLREWQSAGRDTCFVIGGADGLHEGVKRRAIKLFSLSCLTLPHGMVRIILSEQLYRAWSVTQHHPYHRE